jgi:hypothetical protein
MHYNRSHSNISANPLLKPLNCIIQFSQGPLVEIGEVVAISV